MSNTTTWVKGRHTFKGGIAVEYSGEDDFDQINVNADAGRHEQPERPLRVPRRDARAATGLSVANAALGLFTNYAELGQRNFTQWRSLATDLFVQDSWKPTSKLTVEGGVRWVVLAAVVFDDEQHRELRPAVLRPGTGRRSSTRPPAGSSGGARYNGIVLPGDGFEGDATQSVVAQDPAVLALFRGEPRGFSETHANAFEPRLGAAYKLNERTVLRVSTGIFHNRVTLNDSTLARRQRARSSRR